MKIAIFAVFLLFNFSSVFAGDTKVYPAYMCIEKHQQTNAFSKSSHRVTRIKNAGSGELLCPIVRDTLKDNAGAFKKRGAILVKVNTFRTDPAPRIKLTFRKFNSKGNLLQEVVKHPLGGYQSTHLDLKFRSNEDYYSLEIQMGVNKHRQISKVYSYVMYE